MTFQEFAHKLKSVIGGSSNTKQFTKTLFETMLQEEDLPIIEGISIETYKSYYNGHTSISNMALTILSHIEPEQFVSYLESFNDGVAENLCKAFAENIPDIDLANFSVKIKELFVDILNEAANKTRKTPASQKDTGAESLEIPEENVTDESPYSSEDTQLLHDFTFDYDDIMVTMIGENYGASLVDMTLPIKIDNLYQTKWEQKANNFSDPGLKSSVFALLYELNELSKSFSSNSNEPFFMSQTRVKMRNLYVKLHPEHFAGAFPYDVFIDDWNDGEY